MINNNTISNTVIKTATKQALRQLLLAQRQTISTSEKFIRQKIAVKKIIQWIQIHCSHINLCIALYMPHANEPDILALLVDLPKQFKLNGINNQYSFALPVVIDTQAPLQFAKYFIGDKLVNGAYKILIPSTIEWVIPNLILIPCVGYQKNIDGGYRLGYGGGYYDRTLSQCCFNTHLNSVFIGSVAIAWRESECYFDIDSFDIKINNFVLV